MTVDEARMAKLTLSFKDNLIQSHQFDTGIITIGRDPDNTICIDSLAIAPKHVIIDFDHPDGPRLLREDDQFPVRVNGQEVDRHQLTDGDTISLGKHQLRFATEDSKSEPADPPDVFFHGPDAGLQILNGKNIGRLIPLKSSLTRLGKPGQGIAVIARRKQGYFLSSLEGGEHIKLNGDPLGNETIQLNPGDQLEIDRNRMLFYV